MWRRWTLTSLIGHWSMVKCTEEMSINSPCALLFFWSNRRFFNAESKSSFDLMGRTLGRIIFLGTSVVVVVVLLACSISSSTYSSSAYSASPSYKKMLKVSKLIWFFSQLSLKTISCLMSSSFCCGGCCRLLEYIFSVSNLLREQTISLLCVLCQCAYKKQRYKGNEKYAVNE